MSADSTFTLMTHCVASLQYKPPQRDLRMSPLLRYALSTAQRRPSGKPNLLPTSIPTRCCHGLWKCRRQPKWALGDGRNWVLFCPVHVEIFWEAGNYVTDFLVECWGDFGEG